MILFETAKTNNEMTFPDSVLINCVLSNILCVWINEMMAKSFGRHYDISNLSQDYRKEKEESKETMALVVIGDKNNKTEKND